MPKSILLCLTLFAIVSCQQKNNEGMLYSSDAYSIYNNKVVQGNNVAEVISAFHIKSNYKSPASSNFSRLVIFKFSINEKDNELPVGQDHWVIIGEEHESPTFVFGQKSEPVPEKPDDFLPANYKYTIKVDLSAVLKQFEEQGYCETFDGNRVAKADFKGFYIAGGSLPLSWDFVGLDEKGLKLQATDDPNIYSITLVFNPYDEKNFQDREWKLAENLASRPSYTSDQVIVDAIFNLSLEEAIKNIEADSTLRTGAKWGGVWTRDVSYSTLLAFAYHEPEVAKISLRKKVKRGRIVQDTGSGGAWPISSDRTTWVLAAWEIYKVTGDNDWLDEIYPIAKNSLDDDYLTIFDKETGLYRGESSFLDWREQSYPKWMSNMDISASENLGTNVVHYQAHRILAEMAKIKGEAFAVYNERAEGIKAGLNKLLWQEEKGYYGQYLYRRNSLQLSPRFEALGEALAILFEVADGDKSATITTKSPVTTFGTTCIFPQIPGIPPYHNNAIWPFVQSYWNWAAAKSGNEAALNQGLASVYRASALFLTNYENMVAETGDFLGTEINSDRMLWSMAGNLAMVHRIFIGMDFRVNGLALNPVVPQAYGGAKKLSNFKYRNSVLDISVNGYGNQIKKVTIDGKMVDVAFVPGDWKGKHEIIIDLANNKFPIQGTNMVKNHTTLPTVIAHKDGNSIIWDSVKNVSNYRVYKNGKFLKVVSENSMTTDDEIHASYTVSAVDKEGYEGFMSEPMAFEKDVQIIEMEQVASKSNLPYTNYSGSGFLELSLTKNRKITWKVIVKKAGEYFLDFRYSNGNGPWNTDNKCAIRSLSVNGNYEGAVVFPQRGQDEWSDWGYSNSKKVTLNGGENTVLLSFEDWNNNMNGDVNTAMVDFMRVIGI